MENIGSEESSTEFVTAEDLRNLTISQEDRFERDRHNVLESLMTTMVKIASENGALNYAADLNPAFDNVLLSTITNDLIDLGYDVETKKQKNPNFVNPQNPEGEFIGLAISWEEKKAEAQATEASQ